MDVEQAESDKNTMRLHITGPNSDAPELMAEEAENGCDLSSYKAFVTLYEEDGTIETGYKYADSACGNVTDSTLYKGKRLKFIPGSKSKMERSKEKGGMVIIIDADLKKAITFGER